MSSEFLLCRHVPRVNTPRLTGSTDSEIVSLVRSMALFLEGFLRTVAVSSESSYLPDLKLHSTLYMPLRTKARAFSAQP